MRFCALVMFAVLTWGALAVADETSDFEKARIAYVKKDYTDAATKFEAMLDPVKGTLKTKALIDEAQFCYGAVKWAQGLKDEAHKLWAKVILDTAGAYDADPLTYPSDVLNEFIDEKKRMNDEIRQQTQQVATEELARKQREAAERARLEARVKELEAIASTETVVIQNSRIAALLPFGIGQFENGEKALAWFFFVTEGLATAATCILFAPYRYYIDQFNAAINGPGSPLYRQALAVQYAAIAQDIRTADFIILGALGALAISGIVEAQVAFKPTITYTRKRKLTFAPTVSPLRNGGVVGLQGTF